MDLLFELIVECMIGIITDDAIDIMKDSDRTSHLSKGMRIVIVTAALLIFAAIVVFLLWFGIDSIIEGNLALGVPLALMGGAFAIYCVVRFIVTYKKKRRKQ